MKNGSLVTIFVDYRFCSFGLGRRQPTAVKTTLSSIGQPTATLVVIGSTSEILAVVSNRLHR